MTLNSNHDSMEQGKSKAVAIFQANWPVHSQTTNLALMFDEAGYDVDPFLFERTSDFTPPVARLPAYVRPALPKARATLQPAPQSASWTEPLMEYRNVFRKANVSGIEATRAASFADSDC